VEKELTEFGNPMSLLVKPGRAHKTLCGCHIGDGAADTVASQRIWGSDAKGVRLTPSVWWALIGTGLRLKGYGIQGQCSGGSKG
jgi:hypothetical protein